MLIACAPKGSENFLMQSLPMYTLWLCSIFLNDDAVNIGKPDRTYTLVFVLDEFSGLFLHPSIFFIKH